MCLAVQSANKLRPFQFESDRVKRLSSEPMWKANIQRTEETEPTYEEEPREEPKSKKNKPKPSEDDMMM